MSDPQLQYNNIIYVFVFRRRNDWLVGWVTTFFFFFFFFFFFLFSFFFLIRIVEGQNNAECQCEENDRNIQIQEPRLRPEKNSYTGITYFKILGQSVVFFFFGFCFCFYLCLNMLNIHSTIIKSTSK